MSHHQFWRDILFATQILVRHKYREDLCESIDSIVQFLQEDTQWNLRVSSWHQPLTYVMNDMAEPTEDVPKVIDFIEKRLALWNNDNLINGYKNYIDFLLKAYVKKKSSSGL